MSLNKNSPGVSNCYVFKSRLQEYAQKQGLVTPVYETVREGPPHEPCFSSSVTVNNVKHYSLPGFSNRKAAEQSAAEVALTEIAKSGTVNESISNPVDKTGLCKNLLQEYAQKMNYAIPAYVCGKDARNDQHYSCTVEIGGIQYIGAAAKSKKEAEIKAARIALLAIRSNTSTTESGANCSDEPQLTVLPGKKRAREPDTAKEETPKLPKPKKSRGRKTWPKRNHSRKMGDQGQSQPTEHPTGNAENALGDQVGSSEMLSWNMVRHNGKLDGSDVNQINQCNVENPPADQVENSERLRENIGAHIGKLVGSGLNQNDQEMCAMGKNMGDQAHNQPSEQESGNVENAPGNQVESSEVLSVNMVGHNGQLDGADVNQITQCDVENPPGDQVENSERLRENSGGHSGQLIGSEVSQNEQQMDVMLKNMGDTQPTEQASNNMENAPGDQVENSERLTEKVGHNSHLVEPDVIPMNQSSSGNVENAPGNQAENSEMLRADMGGNNGQNAGLDICENHQQMPFTGENINPSNGGTSALNCNQSEEETSNMEINSGVNEIPGIRQGDQNGAAEGPVVAVAVEGIHSTNSTEGSNRNEDGRMVAEGGNVQRVGAEVPISQGV